MDDKSEAAVLVLNLSYLSDRDWRRWAEASGGGAPDWPLISGRDPAALDEIATGAKTGPKVVVLHSEPEQAVREAIGAGTTPEAALATWQQGARALRAALRRHRRTCYLLEAGQLLGADRDALCAALAGWTRQAIEPPAPSYRPPVARDALSELLAMQAVQSTPAIGRLRNELRVGGFAPDPETEAHARQAIMADAARDLHRSQERQRQAREEETALRAALKEVTHRFETVAGEHDSCVADLAAARTALKEQRAEQEAAAIAHAGDLAAEQRLAEQEHALLKQHFFVMQSVLEKEVDAHADLKDRFAQLAEIDLPALRARLVEQQVAMLRLETEGLHQRAMLHECQQHRVALSEERRFLALELERRQQDIAALFDSTSWRVTAPMRALRLTLSRRNG